MRHHTTCRAPSPTLHGLTPPNLRLRNSRRVQPGNCLVQMHPSGCGALCSSTNLMLACILNMTSINGHVLETVVLGETADISPFCKIGFWDWVKFQDKGVTIFDGKLVLGKYLGPSINVGSAMIQHIMKANGRIEDYSAVCLLTPKESISPVPGSSTGNVIPMSVGTGHKQPAMDTCVYEVCFPDGYTKELAANAIAEALCAQYGWQCNPNVDVSHNGQVKVVGGKKVVPCSTQSWELFVNRKMAKLSYLKESHPLQVIEFALATGIANEPAFNWWVTWILKKRDQIISLFGIELHKMVDEAYKIVKAICTTFWCNAFKLQMKNVHVAFDVLADGVMIPPDHQHMRCHMIFDIKIKVFCCKARLVASGYMTKAPATLTYASIMPQEAVRIAQLVAVLNDINVTADVLNAYITMP
ncbi:LOW QUALITY PROTEIN: hypothetical protein ACHAW6_006900 [Cyclotella cf. meneghiniana]